jgi:hypothetical protein
MFYILVQCSSTKGKKISLDLPARGCDIEFRNKNMRSWAKDVFIISGNSHDNKMTDAVKNILMGEGLDLLLIDGDHRYNSVKDDFARYYPFVKNGGYIVFHDILYINRNNCRVNVLWDELKGTKIQILSGEDWGGIGIYQKTHKFSWDVTNVPLYLKISTIKNY